MASVRLNFYKNSSRLDQRHFWFAILVDTAGGFEVVEGEPDAATLRDLRESAIPTPHAEPLLVTPQDGFLWLQAVKFKYTGPDSFVTIGDRDCTLET